MTIAKEIAEFYDAGQEDGRLFQGLGRIEFARMQELMQRHLPPSPAVVADVGGGPGTYACWLATKGYKVHLRDPVPLHVQQTRQASDKQPSHPVASAEVGDARQLDMPDSSVDAVLLHGPMYHLTEKPERLLALAEARRVLRPGGVLLAVAITSYASTVVGVVNGWVWDAAYMEMIREELSTGQHRCPTDWKLFTTSFFHHPDLLKSEIEEAGFQHQLILGIQGPGWMAPDFELAWKDEARQQAILQVARLMEHEPVHSPHMLAVARKPRSV
ncbi:MAG TPA: class I SAM-dependent methyltransferase [Verrucomicrobiae bacterium]|nr:class I SAM-dependent methyltransferase [Verrucomicrobiae bacterium]